MSSNVASDMLKSLSKFADCEHEWVHKSEPGLWKSVCVCKHCGATSREHWPPATLTAPATRGEHVANKNYTEFIRITVMLLLRIRDNPTTAKIDNLLIDLQSLALDQVWHSGLFQRGGQSNRPQPREVSESPENRSLSMQTHENMNHNAKSFLDELRRRAEIGEKSGKASITAGSEGEPVLARWKASNGMEVAHRPDDPQGIIRISVGGGIDTPVKLNYCTIRGSVGQCIDLLQQAIDALKEAP